MPYAFKKASVADLDDILSLVNTLNQEGYKSIIPEEYYKEPFLTKDQIEQMSEIMEFYVYRQENELIAVGSFGKRDTTTAWIPLMHVHSNYQRRGIGSSLLEFLERKANTLSFTKIHLETDSAAEWAINFYTKHGYSVFQKDKNPWGYHVWLEKSLS